MIDAPTQPPLNPPDIKNMTDMGNAERFIDHCGQDISYCHAWKTWLIWDGSRWQVDDTGAVERFAKDTVRKIPLEAALAPSDKKRKAVLKHAQRSESAARLAAMIRLAMSDETVVTKPDEFDNNPMFLNAPNVVIDLLAWKSGKHNRAHKLMKQVIPQYDQNATCPAWDAFLHKIMGGNENLIRFLQRAVGYSITGQTSEQVVFFLHGKGSNGKSTFLEILRYILADYAMNTPTSTIMRSEGSTAANNDVARLRGARLVTAVETEENQRLAESTIKSITGGDSITARFLFSEFFEFKPEFKLWLACNHKPIITGVDNGIWRRIRLIPFGVIIPDSEKDIDLPNKLKAEAAGILNWMLEGCKQWQEQGLGMPEEVAAAVKEYRGEMDTLAQFFTDCCILSPSVFAAASQLYEAYQKWADMSGERAVTQRVFGSKLSERGLEKRRGGKSGNFVYSGIALRATEPSERTE